MPSVSQRNRNSYSTRTPYGQTRNVSEAYDYNYSYGYASENEEDHDVLPQRTWKRLVRKKVKTKLVYVAKQDGKPGLSYIAFVTIFLIFAGCFSLVYTSAIAFGEYRSIESVQSELKTQRDINAALMSEITASFDVGEIERIATQRLGMTKPRDYQIVYYDAPKQSYVVQKYKHSDESAEDTGVVSKIMSMLNIFN